LGNRLLTASGTVAISDGCSGLRSFQSLVMASLFFGELYRLRLGFRAGLLAFGVGVGVLTNLLRAVTLSLISIYQGAPALDRWHDLVGGIAFLVAIVLTLIAARWLDHLAGGGAGARGAVRGGQIARGGVRRLLVFGPVVCVLIVEVFVLFWFVRAPPATAGGPQTPPLDRRFVEVLNLDDNAGSKLLNYDRGGWFRVADPRGRRGIELLTFRYERSNPYLFADVLGHAPESCMSALGMALVEEFPFRKAAGSAAEGLRFRSLAFASKGRPGETVFVFKAHWIGGFGSLGEGRSGWGSNPRKAFLWQCLIHGQRRSPGSAMVVLGSVTGCATEAAAWEFFSSSVLRDPPA